MNKLKLSPKVAKLADELVEVTGVESFSSLFGILVTRYGYHLKLSWQVSAMHIPASSTDASFTHTSSSLIGTSKQLQIPFEQEDPLITRLAGLVDDF